MTLHIIGIGLSDEKDITLKGLEAVKKSDFVYLENLIDMLISCMRHPRAAGETFLISDGDDISTPDLIRFIAHAFPTEVELFPISPKLLGLLGRVGGGMSSINRLIDSFVIDNNKGREVLGWEPAVPLLDGIARTVDWYKEAVYPLSRHPFPWEIHNVEMNMDRLQKGIQKPFHMKIPLDAYELAVKAADTKYPAFTGRNLQAWIIDAIREQAAKELKGE